MSSTKTALQLCEQFAERPFFADLGLTFGDFARALKSFPPFKEKRQITLVGPLSFEPREIYNWSVTLLAALDQGLLVALKAPSDPYEFAPVPNSGPKGPGLLLKTSGSSAKPKVVFHPWQNAALASFRFSAFYGDHARGPWQLNLPLHHIGGLSLLLRCLFLGLPLVSAPDRTRLHPEARAISLVPTQLWRLLKTDDAKMLARFHLILVGGAPASLELRRQAAPYAVSYSYGLTESFAVVGATKIENPNQAYFFPGIQARLSALEEGLELAGPGLLMGLYREGQWHSYENQFYPTHDRARLGAEGHFEILGRLDETIISGGEKILLPEVESVLNNLDQIEEVRALGASDPQWGERLVLFVAPYLPHIKELACHHLHQKLGPHYVPKQILPFPSIPSGAIKLTKKDLLNYAKREHRES